MPTYQYQDDRDGTIHEIFQGMNDEHKAFAKDGYELKRIFSIPCASIDSKWDCDSSQDYVNKTKAKKGCVGDLIDKSRELSEKRKEKYGEDKLQKDYFKKYSSSRNGKRHILDRPKKISGAGFEVDL